MPRAELERLQLERLRETLAWAESRVPLYRDRLNRARRGPRGDPEPGRPRANPVHGQGRSAPALSLGPLRRPAAKRGPGSRVVGDARQAHGGRLHQARPPRLARGHGAVACVRGRGARRHDPGGVRLWPVHRGPRLSRCRGAHGAHGGARLVRQYAAPDPAAAGLPAAGACLHAVVRPLHRRDDARAGDRPPLGRGPVRDVRGRALDGGDARASSSRSGG